MGGWRGGKLLRAGKHIITLVPCLSVCLSGGWDCVGSEDNSFFQAFGDLPSGVAQVQC